MSLISKLFNYVLIATAKYNIDESHSLSHSMNVLHYANQIYETEVKDKPFIKPHERIIAVSAILHDTCDKKYMDEKIGIQEIDRFLQSETELTRTEIDISKEIISTMSYSTVKKRGFPNLGEYQQAYHIVREADLLTAYDFDRSMIYHMNKYDSDIKLAYENSKQLFEQRVFKHNTHGLFLNSYSKVESVHLHHIALERIKYWDKILQRRTFF